MNNLVIFDMDGVLLDARDMHHEAFNRALNFYHLGMKISKEDHVREYDGLPTKKKLEKMFDKGVLPTIKYIDAITQLKQEYTKEWLNKLSGNKELQNILLQIKSKDWRIAVCSNSVSSTIELALIRLGLYDLVDCVVSNEDVSRPKPFPDMYWKAMHSLDSVPSKTIILEDSSIGRRAAKESGAHLVPVTENCVIPILQLFDTMNTIMEGGEEQSDIPWTDKQLHVIIPMAGMGQRFKDAGYTFPKPLIEVHGKPMVQVVVDSLKMPNAHYIFAVQREHLEKYNLEPFLKVLRPGCTIVPFDGVTDGAATTVRESLKDCSNDNSRKYHLNKGWPLIVANSDQYIEWNANETMYQFSQPGIHGGILTFESIHPKYSYVKTDDVGIATEVAEKIVISNQATCGVYYWKTTLEYELGYSSMKRHNIRTNGELYVAPVFNESIKYHGRIKTSPVKSMWGLGTPEDLQYFLANFKGKL